MSWTIAAIRSANTAAGHFFFSRNTMRAFRSRTDRQVYEGPGGIYFVTSEQFVPSEGPADVRRYTVRQFTSANADVWTPSGFQKFTNVIDARAAAKSAAAGIPATPTTPQEN